MSVSESTHKDWRLAIIDDASDFDIRNIVQPGLTEDQWANTTFVRIPDTKEEKIARGGSWIGLWANSLMKSMKSDFVVFLCDDDLLKPNYLEELCQYYTDNPDVMYSYSHIETFGEGADGTSWLNKSHTLDPFCQVDASQVTWRTKCITEGNIRFPYPKTSCLDSHIFGKLCETYGLCPFNGLVGQMKRQHNNQLGLHSSHDRVD